jgi:hypothetical protein
MLRAYIAGQLFVAHYDGLGGLDGIITSYSRGLATNQRFTNLSGIPSRFTLRYIDNTFATWR